MYILYIYIYITYKALYSNETTETSKGCKNLYVVENSILNQIDIAYMAVHNFVESSKLIRCNPLS